MPLKPTLFPEIEIAPMTGKVFGATDMVPALFSKLVFQIKPTGSVGSWTLEKVPLKLAALNRLNVSPAASWTPPMLVTMSVPPFVNAPKTFASS